MILILDDWYGQIRAKMILDVHFEHVSIHSSLMSDLSFAAPAMLFECQVAKTRLMPDFALEAVPKNHRTAQLHGAAPPTVQSDERLWWLLMGLWWLVILTW